MGFIFSCITLNSRIQQVFTGFVLLSDKALDTLSLFDDEGLSPIVKSSEIIMTLTADKVQRQLVLLCFVLDTQSQ